MQVINTKRTAGVNRLVVPGNTFKSELNKLLLLLLLSLLLLPMLQ